MGTRSYPYQNHPCSPHDFFPKRTKKNEPLKKKTQREQKKKTSDIIFFYNAITRSKNIELILLWINYIATS